MFVNLTPHTIRIRPETGEEIVLEPDPRGPARVSSAAGCFHYHEDGVAIFGPDIYGSVTGLPGPIDGTYYIVSAPVGAAVRRLDVLVLGTGPSDGAIRENGQIVAVTRLKMTS